MNILILSEIYSRGGLETHINTYYENLKRNNKIIFGFSKYEKTNYLKDAIIFDNFNFSSNSTIQEFIDDVKRLVQIIKEHKIDVIHVHPFYSLFPALFAANITNTKIVYTYHGRGSVNFVNTANDTILFNFAIENILGRVFCVTNNGLDSFNKINDIAIHIPNIIDENIFSEQIPFLNKKWAFVSRLDPGKLYEIKKIMLNLDNYDIDKLDIYGEGAEKNTLQKFIEENHLEDRVFIKNYHEKLYDELKGKYVGIIGLGRVALESLCMNYPTLLVGFGKIVGIIDKKIFNEIKDLNFVPTEIDEYDTKVIAKQIQEIYNGKLKKYQFRNEIVKQFGLVNIQKYLDEIKNVQKTKLKVIDEVYDEILSLPDMNDKFYDSNNVFQILKKDIGFYTRNINLKVIMNLYNEIYNLKNEMNELKLSSSEIQIINDKLIDLQNEFIKVSKNSDEIEELKQTVKNIEKQGLWSLIKKDIKNIFKR